MSAHVAPILNVALACADTHSLAVGKFPVCLAARMGIKEIGQETLLANLNRG